MAAMPVMIFSLGQIDTASGLNMAIELVRWFLTGSDIFCCHDQGGAMAIQYVEARVTAKHHTITTKNVWSKMSVVQILRMSGLVNIFFPHLYQG